MIRLKSEIWFLHVENTHFRPKSYVMGDIKKFFTEKNTRIFGCKFEIFRSVHGLIKFQRWLWKPLNSHYHRLDPMKISGPLKFQIFCGIRDFGEIFRRPSSSPPIKPIWKLMRDFLNVWEFFSLSKFKIFSLRYKDKSSLVPLYFRLTPFRMPKQKGFKS